VRVRRVLRARHAGIRQRDEAAGSPRGTLAITTWGPDWGEPGSSVFWNCVRDVEPAPFRAFHPWDEITTPAALEDLLARGGVIEPVVEAVTGEHELEQPDDFWDVALGSGYRATVDLLDPEQRAIVKERVVDQLAARDVRRVTMNVVFGTATSPRPLRT
jgi:hypothetical protein